MYGARKSKSWFRPCVSVFYLQMKVCSYITVSVLLEKSRFNTYMHIHLSIRAKRKLKHTLIQTNALNIRPLLWSFSVV